MTQGIYGALYRQVTHGRAKPVVPITHSLNEQRWSSSIGRSTLAGNYNPRR
jgi:hypothetical protein